MINDFYGDAATELLNVDDEREARRK